MSTMLEPEDDELVGCRRNCTPNEKVCLGCGRSEKIILEWNTYTDEQKRKFNRSKKMKIKNGDKQAYPEPAIEYYRNMTGKDAKELMNIFGGLTKREYFAIKMQAAFVSNSGMLDFTGQELQDLSIQAADCLLETLERDKKNEA